MATAGAIATVATGRDRRRRGLVAVLRRALYGLMLWLWAREPALAGQSRAEPPDVPINLDITITSLRPSPGTAFDAYQIAVDVDDQRLSAAFNQVARKLRLRDHAAVQTVRNLRDGVGIDIALPEAGKLHLMLHPRKDDLARGARWNLSDPAFTDASPHRLWSLGGAIDLIDAREIGSDSGRIEHHRSIQAAPQLIIDADRLLGLRGDAVMTVQYSNWKSTLGMSQEQVMQLRLKWSF